MPTTATELPEFYLQPGELRLVSGPSVLKTVLGSCVGITFHVPRLNASALCHPMLPTRAPRSLRPSAPVASRRYVDYVIRELAQEFDALGARRDEVEVKVFGGADVLASSRKAATVGAMNAETALRVLKEEGFTVLSSRLGGSRGFFIEFNTATGEVLLRQLARMDPQTLARA
jgi:chemotaxis protein CheD